VTSLPSAYLRALGVRCGPPLVIGPYGRDALIVCVAVPGFGHVMLRPPTDKHPEWAAVLVVNPETKPSRRPCQLVDGRVEVEMLHAADRLTLVISAKTALDDCPPQGIPRPTPPTERTEP